MSVMTRSIVINAPVGEVFEFARDPSRFVAAIPGFTTQLAVLTSDGVGSLTHATVHELGMHFAGTVEYIEVAPRRVSRRRCPFRESSRRGLSPSSRSIAGPD